MRLTGVGFSVGNMVKKIKNPNYRKFLDEGIIETLSQEEIKQALSNIRGRYKIEGRALLICLYFTGARPSECLEIQGKDIIKKGRHFVVKLKAKKRGLPRPVYLMNNDLTRELYKYAASMFPNMFIFHNFKNNYIRRRINKKGEIITTIETTNKVYYHIHKWFQGVVDYSISPYFLRHNRFSKIAEAGATAEQIRQLKGSKDIGSVFPYLHLSPYTAKKMARKIK